jgi:hypothetical protein
MDYAAPGTSRLAQRSRRDLDIAGIAMDDGDVAGVWAVREGGRHDLSDSATIRRFTFRGGDSKSADQISCLIVGDWPLAKIWIGTFGQQKEEKRTSRMTDSDCGRVFALFSDYLDQELPTGTCEEWEEHMRGCPQCIQFVQGLKPTLCPMRHSEANLDEVSRRTVEWSGAVAMRDARPVSRTAARLRRSSQSAMRPDAVSSREIGSGAIPEKLPVKGLSSWNSMLPLKSSAIKVPWNSPLVAVTVASGASKLVVKLDEPNARLVAW